MNSKFTCGADFARDSKGEYYVCDVMGIFDTIDAAVICNSKLHASFGYAIYEISAREYHGLRRVHGIRSGSPCSGFKIIRKVCLAFNHSAWPKKP